jgi:DNA repair protein RecN (Recombination protein N)
MLATLTIRDIVLIDRLDLEFRPGLGALTGETGAGKSILLDALGLAVGARSDARLVRHGASQASVSAAFTVAPDHGACRVLVENDLDDNEGAIILRRVLSSDGRSRAFVNDEPVSRALLRRVGETLVEIHGQFESRRLLDAAHHRALLDAFGDLKVLVDAVRAARAGWRQATQRLNAATAGLAAARRDEEYLKHVVAELDAVGPRRGEEQELAERRHVLMNAEKLVSAMDEAASALGGGGGRSVDAVLRAASRALERVAAKADNKLDATIAAIDRAASETEEAMALLNRAVADLDLDPGGLEAAEERLFALRALARKHACDVDGLPELREATAARLASLEDGSVQAEQLAAEEAEARQAYVDRASRLSAARREAAVRLDGAVALELEPLRLGKARFLTVIEPMDEEEWGDQGWDRVTFAVATIPGAPPGPLNRIASGGELARFMLALKVVLVRADPVPTLIFDEVDAGIGGAVAAAVGERLARLAADVQVLVVTHSPQVAARGAYQWRVSKALDADGARTSVHVLDAVERKEEIARMLAGAKVTDEARAAADSLLNAAET